MKNFKSNVTKIAIGGVALFSFGIFVGYQLNFGTIRSIQGYLFNAAGEATDANATDANATDSNATNSNATDSNATDSNATDSNATDSNATDSNATDANATDANAKATDNIIYLQSFALGSTSVNAGEKVNVLITTSGACNSGASVVFKSSTGTTFTAQVEDIDSNPYIVIPSSTVATTYSVTDVLLVGKNSDNTTFTKQYSLDENNTFAFDSSLTVIAKEMPKEEKQNNESQKTVVSKLTLNSLSLEKTSAKVGDKIKLNLNASDKLNSLKLVFNAGEEKIFVVYASDLDSNPYIEIPSSVVSGTYTLTNAVLLSKNSSTAYSIDGSIDTEKFDFNTTLEITESTDTSFIYNNDDINSDIITKLYNAPDGTEIIVNADSNTLINEELFNAIKGKNKKLVINHKGNQLVFNGKDISNSKTIDVTMTVDSVSNNQNISKLVSNGVVVNFPDNGNLPGKALVRFKATDDIKSILNDKVYVYVYNESTNNFCVVDTNVNISTDGYYEFTITHNSDYLVTNEKLNSKLVVSGSDENVVSFLKGNKVYLLLITGAIILIIAISVVIYFLKKKENESSSDNKKSNNNMNNNNKL